MIDPSVRITQNDSAQTDAPQELESGVALREKLLTIGDALRRR